MNKQNDVPLHIFKTGVKTFHDKVKSLLCSWSWASASLERTTPRLLLDQRWNFFLSGTLYLFAQNKALFSESDVAERES